jgi:AcrR family transcriptional regulator
MNSKAGLRPGGRSARVQAAVHQATHALLAEQGRATLTVPLIAARAGVTPSTIYRRWGELADLLADVALDRWRADTAPAETGSVLGDLLAWAEQYREEMASDIGQALLRDVLLGRSQGEPPVPQQCATYTQSQLELVLARGRAKGLAVPTAELLMDGVVAPIIYRILFGPLPPSAEQVRAWVQACMDSAA